jgi:hypothetical protein
MRLEVLKLCTCEETITEEEEEEEEEEEGKCEISSAR